MILGFHIVAEVFQDMAADANQITIDQQALGNRFIIDVGAIRTFKIGDEITNIAGIDAGMISADRLIFVQRKIAGTFSANDKAFRGQPDEAFAQFRGVNFYERRGRSYPVGGIGPFGNQGITSAVGLRFRRRANES